MHGDSVVAIDARQMTDWSSIVNNVVETRELSQL